MAAKTEGYQQLGPRQVQLLALVAVDEEPTSDLRLDVRIHRKMPKLHSREFQLTYLDSKNSEDIRIPQQDQKDDTRRGIRFKVGWDFDRMRAKLPGQLALIVTAGSVVWLSVILWATETGDLSTALAIGSFLIGFSALLFDHFPIQKWRIFHRRLEWE